jgi:cobyrinic acid a,c-diamide synthase
MPKGLVIAGTSSGSGKTTLSLALLAALAARGYRLAPFKVGPDFIDPGHHTRLTGTSSRNLDGWMLSRAYNQALYQRCSRQAEMAVVEGVMGLYDGYDGRSEAGSTAQMAKWLHLPVLLVVDARSMARSAAALLQGFENFDPGVCFAGVVFNRIGSPRHLAYLKEALEGHVKMPCLGGIPREASITIPERHLGLHTADDHPLDPSTVRRLGELAEAHVDMDRLIALSEASAGDDLPPDTGTVRPGRRIRIGVARDAAFCFYYPDNLELLASYGAEIVFFSPLTDTRLPEEIAGLYLGGGYPELHAATLSENRRLKEEIHIGSRSGMPIYAECGGFMYLCSRLTDIAGRTHAMAGCFPFETHMLPRRRALGYREIRLAAPSLLGPPGGAGRGHEFHYSELSGDLGTVETVYEATPRSGQEMTAEGFRVHNTLGSYIHLHFGSNPAMACHFVENCRAFQPEERIHRL